MDHPFGAEQFYGNFNSWENTKTWFAGGQQYFGARTTAIFAFRRHSDLFVLYRDRPQVFTNHHADQSYQATVRRRESALLDPLSITASKGCTNPYSNNLGNHSRARGAAYAAVDFRALRASRSRLARAKRSSATSPAIQPHHRGRRWL